MKPSAEAFEKLILKELHPHLDKVYAIKKNKAGDYVKYETRIAWEWYLTGHYIVKYYTGIGSRKVPEDIYALMVRVGQVLAREGWTLRSGGADGSDTAFEEGATEGRGARDIYIAWEGFNDLFSEDGYIVSTDLLTLRRAEEIASQIHPAWDSCSRGAKGLHTRNVFQVLGSNLDIPSKFLICWAPVKKGVIQGGTATAYHLARQNGVECFNLHNPDTKERIEEWLKTKFIP